MKLLDFSDRRIRREAAQWMALLGGEPGSEDLKRFRYWHDSDARHAAAFSRMKSIWKGASELPMSPARPSSPTSHRQPVFGAAFAVALIAAAVFLVYLVLPPRSETPLLLVSAAQAGRSISLADGSTLELKKGAAVRIARDGRRISIEQGELQLLVRRLGTPFIVDVSGFEATANDALLAISSLPGEVAVTASRGTVEVRTKGFFGSIIGEQWSLAAGQRLVITSHGSRVERAAPGTVAMVEFDNAQLAEAVNAINASSKTVVRLSNSKVGALRISGAFREGDADGFARSVAAAFSLRLKKLPDGSLLLTK